MNLHRFNEVGVAAVGDFLDSLVQEPTLEVPPELLNSPDLAVKVEPGVPVEPRIFRNRLDAAQYLDDVLSEVNDADVSRDAGLWTWLTLLYFDQVCPADADGRRRVGQRARYIPAISDYQKYYRHLLAGPYRVFRAHRSNPEQALVLLCGPLHRPGEIVEQLVARQEIITNTHAVEVANAIYYDPSKGTFKRGAAGKGAGSARRLADILNQFDVTWDLYSMPAAKILERLPTEFHKFLA